MEIIKKIFAILSNLPAFTNLFKKAAATGKVDPMEALGALSSISPSTQKIADVAINTAKQGGNLVDAARAVTNMGEVEVMGQKLNTRTLIPDLRKAGGICTMMANIIEKMPNQSPEEVVAFGEAATDIRNWQDIITQ